MGKNRKQYILKRLTTVTAVGFILSVLVIPGLHKHELFHSHAPSAQGFCSHDHDNNEIEEISDSDSPDKSHNSENCPICFFSKYLSGIRYYTTLPNGKEIVTDDDILSRHTESLFTGFTASCFDSRAPPV